MRLHTTYILTDIIMINYLTSQVRAAITIINCLSSRGSRNYFDNDYIDRQTITHYKCTDQRFHVVLIYSL